MSSTGYIWGQMLHGRHHLTKNYDTLKSKSPCILLHKKIYFNKNETESKMENATHSFRETNLLLQLIQKSQIKSETVMSWSSRKKKWKHFLYRLFCPTQTLFQHLCFFSIYSVLNTLSQYTYSYIPRNITFYTFVACF